MTDPILRCGCPSPYHDSGLCPVGTALRRAVKANPHDLRAEVAYYLHFLRNGWKVQGSASIQSRPWREALRLMEEQTEGLLRRSGALVGCPVTKSGHHGEMKHNGRCEFCSMDLLTAGPWEEEPADV